MAIPLAYFVVSAGLLNLSWVVVEVVNVLGFPNEESAAVPDTTPVNQYSHFYAYVVEYWNSCLANEVQEMSMWDKLHKLYQHFETVIPGFALLLNSWGDYVFFRAVFLKFFEQSGLKLLVMKLFIKLTIFGLQLFEKIMYLLRG